MVCNRENSCRSKQHLEHSHKIYYCALFVAIAIARFVGTQTANQMNWLHLLVFGWEMMKERDKHRNEDSEEEKPETTLFVCSLFFSIVCISSNGADLLLECGVILRKWNTPKSYFRTFLSGTGSVKGKKRQPSLDWCVWVYWIWCFLSHIVNHLSVAVQFFLNLESLLDCAWVDRHHPC